MSYKLYAIKSKMRFVISCALPRSGTWQWHHVWHRLYRRPCTRQSSTKSVLGSRRHACDMHTLESAVWTRIRLDRFFRIIFTRRFSPTPITTPPLAAPPRHDTAPTCHVRARVPQETRARRSRARPPRPRDRASPIHADSESSAVARSLGYTLTVHNLTHNGGLRRYLWESANARSVHSSLTRP